MEVISSKPETNLKGIDILRCEIDINEVKKTKTYMRKKSMIRKLVDDEAGLHHWYLETSEHNMEGLHNSNEVKLVIRNEDDKCQGFL